MKTLKIWLTIAYWRSNILTGKRERGKKNTLLWRSWTNHYLITYPKRITAVEKHASLSKCHSKRRSRWKKSEKLWRERAEIRERIGNVKNRKNREMREKLFKIQTEGRKLFYIPVKLSILTLFLSVMLLSVSELHIWEVEVRNSMLELKSMKYSSKNGSISHFNRQLKLTDSC